MSDINFLDNKKNDNGQESANKDKKEKFAWSKPEKEAKDSKNSAFSFLPFLSKKEVEENKTPITKNSTPAINGKMKESREEILNLIRNHDKLKQQSKQKNEDFLTVFGKKLKKQPEPKNVLIDYQKVFNQEKEHKNQIGKIFNIKPAAERKTELKAAEKPRNSWLKKLAGLFKKENNEIIKITKFPNLEEIKSTINKHPEISQPAAGLEKKPAEIIKPVIKENEPIKKNEVRQRVIETNLIQGEIVTFFDWRSKIMISASAVLAPLIIIGGVYYGLVSYQKSNQAKNLAQAQKFAELEKSIAEEEVGLNEIYSFQDKLKTVSQIFSQHIYWSNFFDFLENNTIKDVYFRNFEGDTSGGYIMEALASDYGSIAEQISILKSNKKIISAQAESGEMVSGDGVNKTLVKFVLNFSVLKNIFIE